MKKSDRSYFFGKKGERLLFQEWGALDQPVILLVHGFPGCAEHGRLLGSTPLRDSFRLIAMDRPGYGKSDRQRRLTPMKFARQLESLLNEKKIQNFSILSVSGGAPYAMALAFQMKERVQKITSVAGVAPLTLQNFRYMNSQQKKAWVLRNFVPNPVLEFALNRIWASGLEKIDQLLFTESDSFSTPDQKVFGHPDVGPILSETVKMSLQQGPGGILQDMKTYSRSWGFPLAEVKCPVTLWHGSADDVVHFKFAQDMQKKLPHARLNFMSNEGHYSLPMNCRDAIIEDLLSSMRS